MVASNSYSVICSESRVLIPSVNICSKFHYTLHVENAKLTRLSDCVISLTVRENERSCCN